MYQSVNAMKNKLFAFYQKHAYLVWLLLIQTVVFHQWVFNESLFTFGDVGIYTNETQAALLKNSLSFYFSDASFGNINITSSTNPLLFLLGLFSYFGISSVWSMKWLIFYPIVFGVVLSSYFLVLKLTSSARAAFFGALVYAYNVYFLITLTGALYISLTYALAPFALLACIKVLERPTIWRKISFAFILAVIGYIEFRGLYVIFWILAIYVVFFLFFEKQTLKDRLLQIGEFIPSVVLFLLLNLFWVLPLFLSGKIANNELFNRALFGNSYFDIINALAIFHPWWTGEIPAIFVKQTAPFYFFIIPLVVILALVSRSREKKLPFLVLFILGVFLTKQGNEPFQSVYLWLYSHFPGFNAFREASKFYLISSISFSVLVGYLVSEFSSSRNVFKKILLGSLFIVLFFIPAKSIFSSSLGTMFIPREFPEEYVRLNEFINQDKEYSRVLWFPHTNRFGTYSELHPGISFLIHSSDILKEFVDLKAKNLSDTLYASFVNDKFPTFLENASIRYVVIPSNLKWDDVKSPWRDSDNYIEKLNKLDYLLPIENDYFAQHDIHIYENRNFRPHIFLSTSKIGYGNKSDIQEVDFEAISQTEYKGSLKNIHAPVYLNFSEKYHPDWKVRIGKFHWLDVLLAKQYFLSDDGHFENEFKMNSFLIDPQAIEQSTSSDSYIKNADGSINVDVVLYFSSQSFYMFGLFVSVFVFFLCLLWGLYDILRTTRLVIRKKRYEK